MNKTPLLQSKGKSLPNVGICLLMIALLYLSDATIVMRSLNNGILSLSKFSPFIGIAILLCLVLFKKKKISVSVFCYMVVFSIIILLSGLVNGDNMNRVFFHSAKYICMGLLCMSLPYATFKRHYIFVMRIIAIVSVVLYFSSQIYPLFGDFLPQFISSDSSGNGTLKWGTLFFSNLPLDAATSWTSRNFGPFWEPGAFAMHLNLVLYMNLFSHDTEEQTKKSNTKSIVDFIIFTTALITTLSTGGIISFCFLVFAYLISGLRAKKDRKKKGIILLLCVIAGIYLLFFNETFLELVKDRLVGEGNGSTASRFHSITGNIMVALQNPLLGVGISGVDAAVQAYYDSLQLGQSYVIHNTNTLLLYFSHGGFLLGAIQTYCWYRYIAKNKSIGTLFFLLLFFLLLFLNQDMTGSFVFVLVPLYGILNRNEETNDENSLSEQLPIA